MTTVTDSRPQAPPVQAEMIPGTLRALPQWVAWRYVEEVDRETGKVDYDKPPVNARTGRLASSTNPATWSSFSAALAAYQRGGLDGLGFVLRAEGDGETVVAIDLDKCRDPLTGAVEDWARRIIDTIGSYTEVSPSQRGIRIFLHGKLPSNGRKKGKYENYETGRYVTVTGCHVDRTPLTSERRQAELEQVHRSIFGDGRAEKNGRAGNGSRAPVNLADAEIVRRAGEARNGAKFRRLWAGDVTGYSSHSEADLALCNQLAFWTGPNADRISDLFAQSGLFRAKWQREDYRERTIRKALEGRTEFYTPRLQARATSASDGKAAGDSGWLDTADRFRLNDAGNAKQLAARHGEDLRHCHLWGKWLVWDGMRWREDDLGLAKRLAKETVAELYLWAAAKLEVMANDLKEIEEASANG